LNHLFDLDINVLVQSARLNQLTGYRGIDTFEVKFEERKRHMNNNNFMKPTQTERQGQFLAYIHQYSIVNGCAPAEADMQRFFQITPPSVHSMVLTLERRGFIRRVPG